MAWRRGPYDRLLAGGAYVRCFLTARLAGPPVAFIVVLALAVTACGGAGGTGPIAGAPSSLSPSPSSSPGSTAASSPALSARTFVVTLPAGWLGVDLTPAGLRELSSKLESFWPAVSQALDNVADGEPGPFLPDTTFLAYDVQPAALAQYPTGFNVVETGASDVTCSGLDLESQYRSSGALDVHLDYVDLAVGRVARVSGRFTGGQQDLFGVTFEVRSGGGGYEPYFETLWDLRGQYAPVFDAIVGSIEVTVPGPSLSFSLDGPGQFPHDAPGLEARMPQEALGRPLCTWSVHGAAIWSLFGSDARAEAKAS